MKTRYLERQDGRLAYDDSGGQGPLVIALPGLGDVRAEYRFLAPELAAQGYRVVTMDLRGHGESDTGFLDHGKRAVGDDVLALIDALGAGPAVIIGTSYAAGAAAFAASKEPGRVAGVVLVGPFVRHHEQSPLMSLGMKAMFGGPWRTAAWLWYFDTLFPSRKPPDHAAYTKALAENLRQPGRMEAAMAMMMPKQKTAADEPDLAMVSVPSLIVMGEKDPDFPSPEQEARAIASAMGSDVVMIPGAGHYPHAEWPEPTAQAILAFLQRIAPVVSVPSQAPSQP